MTLRVGVIGTGNIGADHVRRLSSAGLGGAGHRGLRRGDRRRAEDVAGTWAPSRTPPGHGLVDAEDVDAVVIASSGPPHAEQVLACIDAGKPVLCEKPLATTGEDALQIIEAEVALGRRLVQVGFMRRYDRAYRAVKAAMDDGSIGEPLLAHMVHRNASVPDTFTSDMSMTDSVIHEIDTIRWLFDQEIVATTVVASKPSPLAAAAPARPAARAVRAHRRCRRQRRGLRQLPVRLRRALRGRRLRGHRLDGQPQHQRAAAGRPPDRVGPGRLAGPLRPGLPRGDAGVGRRPGAGGRQPVPAPGTATRRRSWPTVPCTPWRRARAAWSSWWTGPPCTPDRRHIRPSPEERRTVKIALDPYMFRTTPLPELPGARRRPRLRVHRALAARGLHAVLPAPAGRPATPSRRSRPRSTRPGSGSPRCSRSTGGRARTRTSARRRSATGSARSRSPSISAVAVMNSEFNGRPSRPAAARRSSGARWRSCSRSSSARAWSCASSRTRTTSSRTARSRSTWCAASTRPLVSFLYCAPHTFHMGGDMIGIMEYAGDLLTHLHIADSYDLPGVLGAALHRQPAGLDGPDPPAPRHRPGRGDVGRVLRDARTARLRRHRRPPASSPGRTGPASPACSCARRSRSTWWRDERRRGLRRRC